MPFSSAIFWDIDVLVLEVELLASDKCWMIDLCLDASPVICSVFVLNVSNIDNFVFFSTKYYSTFFHFGHSFDNMISLFYVIIIIYKIISIYTLVTFYILNLKYIRPAVLINEISKQ